MLCPELKRQEEKHINFDQELVAAVWDCVCLSQCSPGAIECFLVGVGLAREMEDGRGAGEARQTH